MNQTPSPAPKKSRVWLWILAGVTSCVAVSLVAAWFLFPRLVLQRIESEALKHGVELVACQISLSLEQVRLEDCQIKSQKQDLQGRVSLIAIGLAEFSPVSVTASGAMLEARAIPEVRSLLEQQTEALKSELPVRVTDSQLDWYQGDAATPLLRLSALRYDSEHSSVHANLESPGLLKGSMHLIGGRLVLELRLAQAPETRMRAVIQQAPLTADSVSKGEATADIEVEGLTLGQLSIPVFLEIPPNLAAVSLAAQVQATLTTGLNPKTPSGTMRLTISGVDLPVPRELQGVVYGPTSQIEGTFKVDHSYKKVTLKQLTWRAGALELRGSGNVEQEGLGLRLEATLQGNLTCQAIAKSAAGAHLSPELAKLVGNLAKKVVEGGVGIGLDISAHTSQLAAATIKRRIGIGCGLKPASVSNALDVADELLKQLPKLPPPELELPKLPIPSFKPPKFRIPLPDFPKRQVAPPVGDDEQKSAEPG